MITRLAILAAVLLSGSAYADDYILVTSGSNASTKVTKSDLKEMMLGKQKAWKGGGIVHLVMQSDDSKSTEWVSSQIFGVGAKTLITKIRQEVFKGELAKPVMCANDNECLEQAKNIGGALTFVAVGTKLPEGVKPVTIQ